MTAAARQPVEMLPSFRQCLYDLFDSYRIVVAQPVINEHANPGAADALRSWASIYGYEVTERTSEQGAHETVVYLRNWSVITVTKGEVGE